MLSYSVGSSHRISMAFHQSKITFSFDLISRSLEKQNKYHLLTKSEVNTSRLWSEISL